jgi:hypothetical protein
MGYEQHKLRWMLPGESWSYRPPPLERQAGVLAVLIAVLDPHLEQGGNTNVVDTWSRGR